MLDLKKKRNEESEKNKTKEYCILLKERAPFCQIEPGKTERHISHVAKTLQAIRKLWMIPVFFAFDYPKVKPNFYSLIW